MKRRTWIAAPLAAAVLLAACGGDGTTTDPTTDPTTPDAPATTPDEPGETETDGTEDPGDDRADWPDSIVVGFVPSQELDQLIEDADTLGALLAAELGIEVEAVVSQSYTALVVAMETDQAHVGAFGPIAMAQAADQADAIPILQSIRRGAPTYHTQWFTNDPDRFCDDEPVESTNPEGNTFLYCNGTDSATVGPVGEDALANIEPGETIFFVDEASASGYYYPATQLQNAGIDPFSDIDAQFAGGHQNTVQAVERGDGDIGVSFDDARNDLVAEDPEIGQKVVVFAWSDEIPNDGVAVSSRLPQSLQDAIKDAFYAIHESDEGAAALLAIYSIESFQDADLAALDVARQVANNFG